MDRLNDLKRGAANPDDIALDIDPLDDKSREKNVLMQNFLGDIEIIKKNINAIKASSRQIVEINQQVVLATTNEREQDRSTDLQTIIQQTNKKAAIAKKLLQTLRDDTARMKSSNKSQSNEVKIRENLTNTLTRKFVDVMKDYQNIQTKYKTDIMKKVKRQVQIAKPDATSDEIDAVMRSGEGTGAVYKNAILYKGEAADSIRNAYMNVADKFQDVLALEASIAELHQMFLDFALLTEQQGELLDQIQHQVQSASEYIEEGNVQMTKAIELQISIRRKQCCLITIVLVVIGVIVGIILAVQATKNGGKL
mmetsp:Transcript_5631/g.5064  ORF Transcript_5631/g.5064 Transcript_5631/m.5064 type:complete len:309 (+) Transcript_5631:77-1003(+)